MSAVPLTKAQQAVRDAIAAGVDAFREAFHNTRDYDAANRIVAALAKKAHKLHLQLKKAGHEPRFRRAMCENRGVPPDTVEFYNHVHALEDLLKFLADEHANDDPVDRTLDDTFSLTLPPDGAVYAGNRSYALKRTRTGWAVKDGDAYVDCDKEAAPVLIQLLDQDRVDYPDGLGGWFDWLWWQAREQGVPHEEVQAALDELARWIADVNANVPKSGLWEEFGGGARTIRDTPGGKDECLNATFEFKLFSRRWGHDDVYRLKRQRNGWEVEFISGLTVGDKRGYPALYENLRHDSINYPQTLGERLAWLWDTAQRQRLSRGEVQAALDALAAWVRQVERQAPAGALWEGYK
jgi:hypothetical protein